MIYFLLIQYIEYYLILNKCPNIRLKHISFSSIVMSRIQIHFEVLLKYGFSVPSFANYVFVVCLPESWCIECFYAIFFKSTQIPKYIKCLSLLTDLSPLDNSKKFTFWIHQDLAMQAKLLMQYVWEGSLIWNKYIYFFFNPTYFSLKIQV